MADEDSGRACMLEIEKQATDTRLEERIWPYWRLRSDVPFRHSDVANGVKVVKLNRSCSAKFGEGSTRSTSKTYVIWPNS